MPVDLSANGRSTKRDQALDAAVVEIEQLRDALDCAHDELVVAHDALHAIVERKGRGGLKIATEALATTF